MAQSQASDKLHLRRSPKLFRKRRLRIHYPKHSTKFLNLDWNLVRA
jgi:hypothetical protein